MNFFAPTPTSADPSLTAFLPLASGPIPPNGESVSGTGTPILDFSTLLGECRPRPSEGTSAAEGALFPVRERGAAPAASAVKAETGADLVTALLAAGYQPAFAVPAPEPVPSTSPSAKAFAGETNSNPNVASNGVAAGATEQWSPVPAANLNSSSSSETRSSQPPTPEIGRSDDGARVAAENVAPFARTNCQPERAVSRANFDSMGAKVVAPDASVDLSGADSNTRAPEPVDAARKAEAGSDHLFSSPATAAAVERGRGADGRAVSPERSIPHTVAPAQADFGRERSRAANVTGKAGDFAAMPTSTSAAFAAPAVMAAAGTSTAQVAPHAIEPNATRRLGEARSTAKFAATPVGRVQPEAPAVVTEIKSFLAGGDERLASRLTDVGTTVAKTPLVMPTAEITPLAVRPDAYPVADYAVSSLEVPADLSATSQGGDIDHAQAAHRAVEAVLSAVDQAGDRTQQSVTLHFSVGDEQLKVRVERQADEVRAVFATDSDELRAALAQEWQAVGADRQVRGATPVFTTADGGTSSFGDGTSRQQQHLPQQNQNHPPAFPRFSERELDRPATAEPTTAPAISPLHSHHLHTRA